MAEFDLVIKGGTVIDGRRLPRRRADVAIIGGRIAKVGRVPASAGRKVIDASGLVVAPGFVDTHTHYDAQLFWDPYCSVSGWHGVTTVVIGNCGFGFAPAAPKDREYLMRSLTRVEAIPYDAINASLPWTWETFPEWLDQLDLQPKGVNVIASVPLNPLLTNVMGLEASKERDVTEDELNRLRHTLRAAMSAGASGWSAQHLEVGSGADAQRDYDGTPFATDLMSHRTACDLASVAAEFENSFIQITWICKDGDAETRRQVEELALSADSSLIWNAIATDSRRPEVHRRYMDWSVSCARRGIPMFPQIVCSGASFFFTLEDFNMFDDSPTWREATLGTPAERLAKFSDPNRRDGLRAHPPARGLERTTILKTFSPRFEAANNTLLPDAARILGYENIVDCLVDIVVEDGLRTKLQIPDKNEDPELQAEVAKTPFGLWGVSDGGAHTKFLTTGSFPTESIIRFTRDRELVSLEDAHWHLSGLPAHAVGLSDRGLLVEGAAADIIVYDYEGLAMQPEQVVYDLPGGEWRRICKPTGYRHILVNGAVTMVDGEETGAMTGALLRRTSGDG